MRGLRTRIITVATGLSVALICSCPISMFQVCSDCFTVCDFNTVDVGVHSVCSCQVRMHLVTPLTNAIAPSKRFSTNLLRNTTQPCCPMKSFRVCPCANG